MPTDITGRKCSPERGTADAVNVRAGVREAYRIGFVTNHESMLVGMFLNEWRRGEEASAQKRFLEAFDNDLTSWTRIVAAARAGARAGVAIERDPETGAVVREQHFPEVHRKFVTLEVEFEYTGEPPNRARAAAYLQQLVDYAESQGGVSLAGEGIRVSDILEADPQRLAHDG